MRVDPLQSEHLFDLASAKLGGQFKHDFGHRILTLHAESGPVAQCVFTGIAPGIKCEVSMWSEPAARGISGRTFLGEIFRVAFEQWACKRVSAFTRQSNEVALAALARMGFVYEATLTAWFGDEDGVCFRMLRPECRWINAKSEA